MTNQPKGINPGDLQVIIERCLYVVDRTWPDKDIAAKIERTLWPLLEKTLKDARAHTELLIYRVISMRELQKEYFAGKRSVLDKSKQAEARVDAAIQKLLIEMGYSIEEIKAKYEQTKLF